MPFIEETEGAVYVLSDLVSTLNQLCFTQDYRIFDQFSHMTQLTAGIPNPRHIQVQPLPENKKVVILTGEGEIHTRTDSSGEDIVIVTAAQMKQLSIPDDISITNKAIMAFVHELPDQTPIIMMWE